MLPSKTLASSPAVVGPVLVEGKSTLEIGFTDGATKIVGASQAHAPRGALFLASPSILFLGVIRITGAPSAIASNVVASDRLFSITKIGSPTGRSIQVSSDAGGAPATITFR